MTIAILIFVAVMLVVAAIGTHLEWKS